MAATSSIKIPSMLYGTAWKKERTRNLVKQAILAGFRGVDTAAQPKHYQEDLVGDGLRDAQRELGLPREQLYIQTKFTSIHGQDPHNLPYDPALSIPEQIDVSIGSSLAHLHLHPHISPDATAAAASPSPPPPYIDCLVLHSPYPSRAETQTAWRALERHVPDRVRRLGISNIYDEGELRALWDFARVKPAVVQNRFHAATRFDAGIRRFCAARGVVYQSFWTLTANPRLVRSKVVGRVAAAVGVENEAAMYALVLGLGEVAVLNGTTRPERMEGDLIGLQKVREWADGNGAAWEAVMEDFRGLLS